jgi:hypothetical protein
MNAITSDVLLKSLLARIPKSGAEIIDALSTDDQAEKFQGLNNLNKTASAWLSANPAFYANQLNNAAFTRTIRRRNLVRTFTELTCRCEPLDRFGQHAFACENPYIKTAVTNATHKHLSRNLKQTMDTPMRNIEMEALRSEPALDEYFEN